MGHLVNGTEVVTPTAADTALAKESGAKLAARLGDAEGVRLQLKTGVSLQEFEDYRLVMHRGLARRPRD